MKNRFQIFSENLKNERIAKGYTQKQMAEKLGITQPVYNRYERGGTRQGREPDMETVYRITGILEVGVNILFDEN